MDARGGNDNSRSPVPPPNRPDEIGIIREVGPNGEEDFDTNQYWVEAQFCSNDAGDANEALKSTEYPEGNRRTLYTMMTNISEPEDEHNLEPGTRVRWNYVMDRSAPQQRKYLFTLAAAAAIVATGHFNALGSIHADSFACWNGKHWRTLKSATAPDGTNWDVRDVAIYNGEIYICGRQIPLALHSSPGFTYSSCVAKWNGTDWRHLGIEGDPMTSGGLSVAHRFVHRDGKLVVVGDGVVQWDGSSWSTVGAGGPTGGDCWDAVVYLGELHVVGEFNSPGPGWAKYDGVSWSAVSTGLQTSGLGDAYGYCLHVDGDDLYVGGGFEVFCGVADAFNVGKWRNGVASKLGSGMTGSGSVKAMLVHENQEGRFVYACGIGVLGNPLARFTGTTWQPVGAQLYAAGGFTSGTGLCEYQQKLIMSGAFDAENEVQFSAGMSRVARGDHPGADTFDDLGIGVNAAVRALAIYAGDVHAGGAFTKAKQTDGTEIQAHRLAAYNQATDRWRQVVEVSGQIRALCPFGGKLVFGGDFTTAGGLAASYLARWNGAIVDTFGGTNGPVHVLYDDAGILNVGGEFTIQNGFPANAIAWFDGAAWGTYGGGFSYSAGNAIVRAIIKYGGSLYACGRFDGGGLNYIARWNGAAWVALAGGLDGEAYCMFEYDGKLWVGGDFQNADGIFTPYLAYWDGAAWNDAGVSLFRMVEALHEFDGSLWVAATDATGNTGRIFTWDTSSWAELTESFRGRILAITSGDAGAGDHPYVAGDFNRVGDTTTDAEAPANRVMRYDEDGLFNVGGGVGLTPHIPFGLDGGAGYGCRTLTIEQGLSGTGDPETLLFVLGRFGAASDVIAESYGRRSRKAWRPLGRGLRADFGAFIRQVRHAVKFDDGDGIATYVCGAFSKAVNDDGEGGVTSVDAACCARFRHGSGGNAGAWSGGMDMDNLGMELCVHAFPENVSVTLDAHDPATGRLSGAPGTFVQRLHGTRITIAGSGGGNNGDYVIKEVLSDSEALIYGAWPGSLPDSATVTLRVPNLYCVGWFSVPDRVGVWNVETETWDAVGDLRAANGGSDFIGWTMCSFADLLWVGITGGKVFAWDGAAWTNHSPPDCTNINHLLVGDLGDGETIYAAVDPDTSGGPAATVRKMDAVAFTWSDVGSNTGAMKKLAILKADTNPDAPEPRRLVAFNGIDIGGTTYNVAEWNGVEWVSLGDIGSANLANSLVCIGSQSVIIGGNLSEVSGLPIQGMGELVDEWGELRRGGANGDVLYLGRARLNGNNG